MELKGQFVPGATEDPPSPIALNLGVLTPGEIRDIDLSDLLQTGRISPSVTQGSVSLTYSGSEGAVIGRYIGISANKAYGYYSALESFAGHAVSELYWTVSEDWQPILTVANFSPTADRVTIAMTYTGGSYVLPDVSLASLQSYTVNIRDLLNSGRPDRFGHTIPDAVQMGGYRILGTRADSSILVKEHLVSLSKQISVPLYGGQMYTVAYTLDPPSITISTGDTQAVTGQLEDSDGSFRAYCVRITVSDPNVGTIVGSSSCPMTFTAVGPGAAQVQGRSNGLIIDPQGDRGELNSNIVPVQVTSPIPTSLTVLSATSVGCPGSMNYGERIDVQYQVLDQYMKPLQMAGLVPYEKGTFFTGGNFDEQLGAPTASDGTFHDNPVGVCSSIPIPGLPLTATQAIRIGADGNPVRSQTLTLSAPAGAAGFGHGTIVNSLMDINVSR